MQMRFYGGKSHLLQMRGLKPWWKKKMELARSRIFYRCVDWNRDGSGWPDLDSRSHLLQMRGLKPPLSIGDFILFPSHLLQMRGLKLNFTVLNINIKVASFTDAWIETHTFLDLWAAIMSRIFYRCVDWNLFYLLLYRSIPRRIFYRCVDWNRVHLCHALHDLGRIFYRCVDWNCCREYC